MKAVGYLESLSIEQEASLLDIEIEKPSPTGRDILVRVGAVSVNPVDTKVRINRNPNAGQPEVLGWDAVGEVVSVGPEVAGFQIGDVVWYAGDISRRGSNAEYQLVDERLVGHKPSSLTVAEAAALPLTSLTAYEMLFDRIDITKPVVGGAPSILVIGGAGGVGSIAIQLLATLSDLTIIATASRPETQSWALEMGADYTIDHRQPLVEQFVALGLDAPSFVFSTTHSETYVDQIADLIAPQGRFGLIDDPVEMSIKPFKSKSISIHWELMFSRSLHQTRDMARQGEILNKVSELVDQGKIKSTATQTLGNINASNLRRAHALLESGHTRGKLVLEGF